MQGAWIQFLAKELRSHMLHNEAKRKKRKHLAKNKSSKEKKLSEDIEKIDDMCFGNFTVKTWREVK